MKVYQPIKDSMGGGGPMPFVYTEKRAAEIWAEDHNEEWTSYKIVEVECRVLTNDEGAVNSQLVSIRRQSSDDAVRVRALLKLNAEERHVLKLL